MAKLDDIYAQFKAARAEIPDQKKKHREMGLISDAAVWGSMAHLLGTADAVSYTEWRQGMLRKEEEFELNGVRAGQRLADELYGMRNTQDNALMVTSLHQTFRGSGFRRGRLIPRGWSNRGSACGSLGRNSVQQSQHFQRGSQIHRGGMRSTLGAQRGRSVHMQAVSGTSRPMMCFSYMWRAWACVCSMPYGLQFEFQGSCHRCRQYWDISPGIALCSKLMFLQMNLTEPQMGIHTIHEVIITNLIMGIKLMHRIMWVNLLSIRRSRKL